MLMAYWQQFDGLSITDKEPCRCCKQGTDGIKTRHQWYASKNRRQHKYEALMPRRHIVAQDYCGTYLVNNVLVAPRHLPHATVKHGLMGKNRGEPLVVTDYRHVGNGLAPPADELVDPCEVLAGSAVGLFRLAYHDAFHTLTSHIVAQKSFKPGRGNGGQPSRNYL